MYVHSLCGVLGQESAQPVHCEVEFSVGCSKLGWRVVIDKKHWLLWHQHGPFLCDLQPPCELTSSYCIAMPHRGPSEGRLSGQLLIARPMIPTSLIRCSCDIHAMQASRGKLTCKKLYTSVSNMSKSCKKYCPSFLLPVFCRAGAERSYPCQSSLFDEINRRNLLLYFTSAV